MAKQLEQMQKTLDKMNEAHKQAMKDLKEQIKQAQAAGQAEKVEKLQQQLNQLEQQKPQMAQLSKMAQQLGEAAKAMQQGQGEKAQAALGKLGDQLAAMQQSQAEMELLEDWYLRTIGEIPAYVGFLRQHRPRLLKSWRNRYENILFELPKQVMPYSQLHFNVMRGWADGIRESVLLARAFGLTKEQVYEPLFSPMINTGPEAYSIVSQAAGDVLAADDWPS